MHKRGILGGTFDPVHCGHLLIAETALNQMALEQVIWVPTRCPTHKQAARFEQRLEMVQLAIADNPGFALSAASAKRYSIETLTVLKALYPNTHWYWIIGLDAFQTLPQWYQRQELVTECDWLVAPRTVSTTLNLDEQDKIITQSQLICEQVELQLSTQGINIFWQILPTPWVGFSSSLIRQYCSNGYSIRYLVPEVVRSYIATHNLYPN